MNKIYLLFCLIILNQFAQADDELNFKLMAQDIPQNIYQVDVLNQFNAEGECPVKNMVYGLTCGRHAFKNALFGLIALQAQAHNNKAEFEEATKDMLELTPISECIFKEINAKIDEFRKEQAEQYVLAGLPIREREPTLSPEEVQYVLEDIIGITFNCGLVTLFSPEDFSFIYFPPEGTKNFLTGQYGNAFVNTLKRIERNNNIRQAILLLIPGHWITVIANKVNGKIEFFVFDSAGSNRLQDANVQELMRLVNNSKEVLDNLAKEEAELKKIGDELKKFEELKDNIYAQADLPNIVEQLKKIADQDSYPDLKKRAAFLLTKIYFKGGNGVEQNFNLAQEYAAMAPVNNAEINAILRRIDTEKLTFPPNRRLRLFIEPGEPLEYSYQGLIAKYKQSLSTSPVFARKLLNILNEIAYTKEGYANRFVFIRQYLEDNSFAKNDIQKKLGIRNLKLFKEQGDSLRDSYQGLIEKYKFAKHINNLPGQFYVLNLLNEIAYTKEGYANKFAFIREYLESKGFSQKELDEKLGNA